MRVYQVRDEYIDAWIGQTDRWSDYAISFSAAKAGTVIALIWVESVLHPPMLERQLDAFLRQKLDARPL